MTHNESIIAQRFANVFDDAIILDAQHCIVSISAPLSSHLGCTSEELIGTCISLVLSQSFKDRLKASACDFGAGEVTLSKKDSSSIQCNSMWFRASHLGSSSDVLIVRVRNLVSLDAVTRALEERTHQLDAIMHCAWHNLRGPIATIQGIMNLAKTRTDNSEIEFYFKSIREQIEKLDDQLRMLLSQVNNRL